VTFLAVMVQCERPKNTIPNLMAAITARTSAIQLSISLVERQCGMGNLLAHPTGGNVGLNKTLPSTPAYRDSKQDGRANRVDSCGSIKS